MPYHQITPGERYTFSLLRKQGFCPAEIARITGRHRSTVVREFRRNSNAKGIYRVDGAQEHANARRWTPRRNTQFGPAEWGLVEVLLKMKFSPEQISGFVDLFGVMKISHETIYQHVWRNKRRGGDLWRHLRQPFKRRKRYRTTENRGWAKGKRHISERPAAVETRHEPGHWEMDTVLGTDRHCIVSLVERASGALLIGKLCRRNVAAVNARVIDMIHAHSQLFKTITADNGSEFNGFVDIEKATGVPIYFANPYHSWERGTNENTNGLIRQYLPKRTSMKHITQAKCNSIAAELNSRPRKRYAFQTPLERLEELTR